MVEIEELVRFLRRGKTSEAEIRIRFDVCPRKLLKELVEEKLIYKSTSPTRYYATPINKVIKTKIKLMEGGIITNPKNGIIHGGTTLPPGIEVEKTRSIETMEIDKAILNSKSIEKAMERVWGTPKPKKDGWFKRLLKRNAKH